jgi:hypothetical protein
MQAAKEIATYSKNSTVNIQLCRIMVEAESREAKREQLQLLFFNIVP